MAEQKVTLFEEESGHEAYMKSLRKDLLDTMEAAGCSEVINHQRNKLSIASEMIDCDLYMTYTMERLRHCVERRIYGAIQLG